MLYGCYINGVNTLDEYGLFLLSDVKIGAPEKKTNYVDIPGADGSLDMSDYPQGRPVYKNRTISFRLFRHTDEVTFARILTCLRKKYHGRSVRLVLPNDCEHYYKGVMSIGDTANYHACTIPVTVLAEPYKLQLEETEVVVNVSGAKTVSLYNEGKPAVPEISTTGDITIAWGSSSVAVSAGSGILIPSFILEAGYTDVTITGTATVTMTYQEGTL